MSETKEFQPHQQRVVDEKNELAEKVTKLGAFILDNPIFNTLDVEEQTDLHRQYAVMQTYLTILDSRISRF